MARGVNVSFTPECGPVWWLGICLECVLHGVWIEPAQKFRPESRFRGPNLVRYIKIDFLRSRPRPSLALVVHSYGPLLHE